MIIGARRGARFVSFAGAAMCVGLLVLPEGAARPASPRRAFDAGSAAFVGAGENYNFHVGSAVQSVTAGESLTGTQDWGFNNNNNGPGSLTGVQMRFAADGSGADYTDSKVFYFNYTFFPPDPNAFTQNHPCPPPSATQETCPSPAITLPPSTSDVTVFTGPGTPITATPGFDATRSLTAIPSSTDAAIAVAVTLRDARYAPSTQIRVTGNGDNADTSYPPTVTSGGQTLPTCQQPRPQPGGAACAVSPDFGAYQGKGGATCESVSMFVENAQIGTEYDFGWRENESSSGCPAGEPGVGVIGFVPGGQNFPTQPCDSGTDCSFTQSIPGVGNVTTTVDPGQVTGFSRGENSLYNLGFDPEQAAPAPSGTVSSAFGASASAQGTATATNDGTTASAAGQGALTVSQWGSDPVTSPPFMDTNKFFDIQVLSGSRFATLVITDCNTNNANSLDWWNGTSWVPVTPTPHTDANGCVVVTLSKGSQPNLSQLVGTMFATAAAPVLTVSARVLVVSAGHVRLGLQCSRLACQGTATLERPTTKKAKPVVLGSAKYALAAGKTAKVAVTLNAAGRKTLAHVSRAHPFSALLSVSVRHGSTVLAPVLVTP